MRSPSREPGSLAQKHNSKEGEGQSNDCNSPGAAIQRHESPGGSSVSLPVHTTEDEVANQKVPPGVTKSAGAVAEDDCETVVQGEAHTLESNGAFKMGDEQNKSGTGKVANTVGEQASNGDLPVADGTTSPALGRVKDREGSTSKRVILSARHTGIPRRSFISVRLSWDELDELFKDLSLSSEPLTVASVPDGDVFLRNIQNERKYGTLWRKMPMSHCAKQHWMTTTQSEIETKRQFKENLTVVALRPVCTTPPHVHSSKLPFSSKITSCVRSLSTANIIQSQDSVKEMPQRLSHKRRRPDEEDRVEWPSTFNKLAETFSTLQVSSPSTKKRCLEGDRMGGGANTSGSEYESEEKKRKGGPVHNSLDKGSNNVQKIATASRITLHIKPTLPAGIIQSVDLPGKVPSSRARRRRPCLESPSTHPHSSANSTCRAPRSILGKRSSSASTDVDMSSDDDQLLLPETAKKRKGVTYTFSLSVVKMSRKFAPVAGARSRMLKSILKKKSQPASRCTGQNLKQTDCAWSPAILTTAQPRLPRSFLLPTRRDF